MKIEKKDGGICIGEKLYFGPTVLDDRICLSLEKGEEMNYGQGNTQVVSFPGEYDIQDVAIRCIDAGNMLHYVVNIDDKWIAILQASAALEKENIEGIDTWYVLSEETKKEIENLEMGGEIVLLEGE